MKNRGLAIVCLTLLIIASTVLSQEECYKPRLFTNRATLDRYLRCLRAKLSPRYGKRTPTSVTEKPDQFISRKPSHSIYNDLYRMLQSVDDSKK